MFTAHTCPTHSYSVIFMGTSYRQFRRSHFLLESVKYTIPSCVISKAFRNFSGSPFTPIVGNKLSLIMEKIGQINVQFGFQIIMNNFNMIIYGLLQRILSSNYFCGPYIYICHIFHILSFEIEKVLVKNEIKIMNKAVALFFGNIIAIRYTWWFCNNLQSWAVGPVCRLFLCPPVEAPCRSPVQSGGGWGQLC